MLIKNIMIPLKDLTTISIDDTVEKTINLIDSKNLLSLPVLEDKKFVGIISKKYIFEEYFNHGGDKNAFLERKVKEFMKTKLQTVSKDELVERSLELLSEKNLQFIPVVDEKEDFCGIVTHKAVFSTFKNALGIGHVRLVITTYDMKGRLAKIAETIAKEGGNIISIVEVNPEVMDLRELIIRVDIADTNRLVTALNDKGFKVRSVDDER